MKRVLDIVFSFSVLVLFCPILIIGIIAVFLEDLNYPLYTPIRVGKNGRLFRMLKIRSMVVGADKSGIESTGVDDSRITKVGKIIRKYKVDEISQFWNVIVGDMSIVGPRPNTVVEAKKYCDEEKRLLQMKPGITDISSIVFSDEGEILSGSADPDEKYQKCIRPWKSRLGILYIEKSNIVLDFCIIICTAVNIFNRRLALKMLSYFLKQIGAQNDLVQFSLRKGY